MKKKTWLRLKKLLNRMLVVLESKFFEETYKELYEKQNLLLDQNALTITKQRKTIAKLTVRNEVLEIMYNALQEKES